MTNLDFKIKGFRISSEIIRRRFAKCNLHSCKHACCCHGAVIGTERIYKIKKLLPKLFPYMRAEAVKTVKEKGFHLDTVYSRSDFDNSHKHHNLRISKGRCVFLNFDHKGGCVLQKYVKINKMNFELKPVGCYAFPIDLIGNKLTTYKWKKLPCLKESNNRKSPRIYKSCKQEIICLIGKDGYNRLLAKIKSMAARQLF